MDLDAILARKPQVCIVDEIPHTNVPGGKNKKRYQDVLDILAAGINVIGALNIQHLESLKDVVEKVSGVPIRETVPDSFLKEAVQVVNLDLSVEDLIERLRAGKIYAADKVEWALEHFFQDANLMTLRELALREVAESLERQSESRARGTGEVARRRAARSRDAVHVVVSAARRDVAAQGLADGRPAVGRLVRGLRRDAARGAGPDRRRGAAPSAREHRARARARRRGRAVAGARSGAAR